MTDYEKTTENGSISKEMREKFKYAKYWRIYSTVPVEKLTYRVSITLIMNNPHKIKLSEYSLWE